MLAYTLTNWKIKSDSIGRIYLIGNYNNREWETSTVLSLKCHEDKYVATTANSVYNLYF